MLKILAGKKTYLVATVMLIHAVSGYALGEPVNWTEVLTALGFATLRNGLPAKP